MCNTRDRDGKLLIFIGIKDLVRSYLAEDILNSATVRSQPRSLKALIAIFMIYPFAVLSEPIERFVDCDNCPEMIMLPKGYFFMGAQPNEVRRRLFYDSENSSVWRIDDEWVSLQEELPRHKVEVDIKIAMSRDEITYDQWMYCVEDGGCNGYRPATKLYLHQGPNITGRHPVTRVSFDDALTYVEWLNTKLGSDQYRLPTEAEWEYAARSGTMTRFAQGDELTSDQANFSGKMTASLLMREQPNLLTRGKPVPVDELDAANLWGFRHMAGNVSEATLSCYTKSYKGWNKTSIWLDDSRRNCLKRVFRGGNYRLSMNSSRPAARAGVGPKLRSSMLGFRIVKENP